ncbi:hypothetical protein [Ralstonia mannitolilytica]|uniref:Uncharacterized protein n=1 Tax=Ralstonia mannitolilytica TaxID=105219 RepID=A0AAJ4ZQ81_9RALS|nr:hypothetical protein [Ralstonia mannitolilytica]CAG2132004.1 hypothetical protein LMG6866_00871 [Ralstonia mannitolilytica]CAJ0729627.1 hypothetical protein R77592_02065 [Ralstonia mannitolilytica]SUE25118.1 Uncharacterised protein [Ralstonia mannitolilytica]SUE26187.1 Uncharacterised protein [Ralstonia mannitolilytica]SUE35998.1 Uncharacterised protein [Ralstonia mannitolilytica]
MAIRFPRALWLAALAATLATGTALAAQDLRGDCCEPQAKPMAAPLAKTGTRDAYTDGARTGARDPYTGGAAQAVLEARVGARDPYTDGGLSGPRARDPYAAGAHA